MSELWCMYRDDRHLNTALFFKFNASDHLYHLLIGAWEPPLVSCNPTRPQVKIRSSQHQNLPAKFQTNKQRNKHDCAWCGASTQSPGCLCHIFAHLLSFCWLKSECLACQLCWCASMWHSGHHLGISLGYVMFQYKASQSKAPAGLIDLSGPCQEGCWVTVCVYEPSCCCSCSTRLTILNTYMWCTLLHHKWTVWKTHTCIDHSVSKQRPTKSSSSKHIVLMSKLCTQCHLLGASYTRLKALCYCPVLLAHKYWVHYDQASNMLHGTKTMVWPHSHECPSAPTCLPAF